MFHFTSKFQSTKVSEFCSIQSQIVWLQYPQRFFPCLIPKKLAPATFVKEDLSFHWVNQSTSVQNFFLVNTFFTHAFHNKLLHIFYKDISQQLFHPPYASEINVEKKCVASITPWQHFNLNIFLSKQHIFVFKHCS